MPFSNSTRARSSRRPRLRAACALTLLILGGALSWSRGERGFATPAACLDAFREAKLQADAAAYLQCLGEPLRAEMQRRFAEPQSLPDFLRREMRDVRGWVITEEAEGGGQSAAVELEEVRTSGNRRSRLQLARTDAGWLIVEIQQHDARQMAIPFGTHVSQAPD